ncbi:hypothetical protein RRG08_036377 [Elysia crispata]|uniref:TELO2-interacting protein 2 n=1 Tax=Elysia crispata TaxID=231223 RepID=A0AAE1DI97_9GAST|nr:hypothetical protein RRG08_036377 [Elysia crispata]
MAEERSDSGLTGYTDPEILNLMESVSGHGHFSLRISTLERCVSAVKRCSQGDVSNLMKDPYIGRFFIAVQHVLQAAIIPPFDSRYYFSYCEDDFKGFSQITELVLSLISELINLWKQHLTEGDRLKTSSFNSTAKSMEINFVTKGDDTDIPDFSWLYSNQMKLLIIIGAHLKCGLWSSTRTQMLSNMLLQQLMINHNNSVSEFLCAKTRFCPVSESIPKYRSDWEKSSLLTQILDHCKLPLGKEQWQKNPFLAEAFTWTISNVRIPHLSDHINQIMVTSLNFIDDHQAVNKVRGIKLLHHLLQNTSAEEMRWYNRAEVIYESLKHQLYSKELEVQQNLWPCLLSLLQVLEPGRSDHELIRHHDVFETLLREAESENLLAIRRVYMIQLKDFTTQIGIGCVRHLKTLVRVIEQYLEIEDGPEDQARCGALALLHTVITVAWPRLNQHMQKIVHSLCKFLLDINSNDATIGQISSDARMHMNEQAVDILKLLKQIAPNLQPCLKALKESNVLANLEPILKRVL